MKKVSSQKYCIWSSFLPSKHFWSRNQNKMVLKWSDLGAHLILIPGSPLWTPLSNQKNAINRIFTLWINFESRNQFDAFWNCPMEFSYPFLINDYHKWKKPETVDWSDFQHILHFWLKTRLERVITWHYHTAMFFIHSWPSEVFNI